MLAIVLLSAIPLRSSAQFGPVHDIDTQYATDLPKVGTKAPDFKMKTIDGKNFKLSSLKGKVVVLDFWASWCPDCRRDMPEMMRIYDRFKDKATFVGVSFDTDINSWRKAVDK
ncbi:peroxiredoxin family protein [Prevotella sp. AGR2160]|uniref:peroxiredoxin family protein n=1 Tax=Prevotella sp. AGR2160 TaxID=1280674 RepID=UPI001E4C0117|nr:TlpA disulfide reductase family protein [Prevotella sp. AGR2160]